ncbi:X-ray repair cross-complementing protein 6 isoform X2 [Scyliorhinus canicula]|nr:X-ray repair cross-complementing protein 6 isoform X2 [Scyliorhinus canicula]XP_038639632.1 X-ray repair cross-complementing protein 6 isoform X2 [Scyliorhinus canicula]XP_038639633.1 X-ray repair cross-complementing protein 6 isoform X2 [Scyliorhinus canicula]XP_038639634.1 X-ray repair cross-complementing protein 6 isoform X2 [Scyliorhinus canicula]
MSDWHSHFRNEYEDDQEEAEDNDEDVRYVGRDSLVFLIDASEAMFEMNDEDISAFDMTIQCVHKVYTSKIISSDRDLLAVAFFGTEKHQNSVDFKHVYVLHDLDTPGAKRVLELDQYEGEKGNKSFKEKIGHSADGSLSDALWVCSNLFSDVRLKLSHKRIMLFTNNDDPHTRDSSKARMARTKASDLRETGIVLDLMNLKKPGGFDTSLFYCDIVSVSEDEDAPVQSRESAKLDDLLRKVWAKDYKKRAVTRLSLKLGEGVEFSVGVYNLIRGARKPSAIRLDRETNEPVKTKTRWFNGDTGSLLLPSDTRKAQVYGHKQIVLEKEETEELKRFDNPGLVLIGFKPLSLLKKHHHIRPSQFIYPEETLITGSTTLFSALLTKCLEKEVFAVCRYTPRRNTPPRFVAMSPQEEELDDQKVQTIPSGFHLIFLPYADDIRSIPFTEKRMANEDQIEKMKSVVQKLRFKYRPESFENPVIQRHFRSLEALALDLKEPEEMEDLTLPKNDVMDKRIGHLAEEFNELVYPPDYNPDAKSHQKRKLGEAAGGAAKKPKVELSLGEDEVRQYLQSGTLGKLTVPVLKDVCKQYGLRGSKKQELIDAITGHFAKN